MLRTDSGHMIFGDKFFCNRNCSFFCNKEICFGSDVLVGWEVRFRDTNGHQTFFEGRELAAASSVVIGNHVWIASYVDLLKGVRVQDGSIIGYRSLVLHAFSETNALIAGSPAKLIRENVDWRI